MKAKQFNNISYEPKLLGLTLQEVMVIMPVVGLGTIIKINPLLSFPIALIVVILARKHTTKALRIVDELTKGKNQQISKKELQMLYPVLPMHDTGLISLTGEKSYVWKLLPPDLEQLLPEDRVAIFRDLKNSLNSLDEDDWIRIENRSGEYFINSNKADLSLNNFKLVPVKNPQQVFLADHHNPKGATLSGSYITQDGIDRYVIPVAGLPSEVEENLLAGLGDCVLVFKKENPLKVTTWLNRKRNQLHASGNKGPVDYKEIYGANDIEGLKSSLDKGNESFWNISIFFTVIGSKSYEASNRMKELEKFTESRGITLEWELINIKNFYLETIWGNKPRFKYGKINSGTTTSVLTMLMPTTDDFMMSEGFSLQSTGHESGNSKEIKYDITDASFMNGHLAVAGASGSGKSLFVQYVTDHYIENGSHAIICDKGRSFERFCHWHGGEYLDQKINFLEFKEPEYLTELVLSLMEGDNISREEQGYLYSCVKEAVATGKAETHGEFVRFLNSKKKGIGNYFSKFLEITTDEKRESNPQLLICEINDIDPKFHSAVFLYLFERFLNMPSHKIFVFEEIHSLLRTQGVRISQYFREQRKKGASCISITQSVNDNKQHPLMDVIWENSEHKAIFKHENSIEKGYLSAIQEQNFELLRKENSKGAINKHDHSNRRDYSELVLSSSSFCKRVRLYIDPVRYAIYNTTPIDSVAFNGWFNKNKESFTTETGIDYRSAIVEFAGLRYA